MFRRSPFFVRRSVFVEKWVDTQITNMGQKAAYGKGEILCRPWKRLEKCPRKMLKNVLFLCDFGKKSHKRFFA